MWFFSNKDCTNYKPCTNLELRSEALKVFLLNLYQENDRLRKEMLKNLRRHCIATAGGRNFSACKHEKVLKNRLLSFLLICTNNSWSILWKQSVPSGVGRCTWCELWLHTMPLLSSFNCSKCKALVVIVFFS